MNAYTIDVDGIVKEVKPINNHYFMLNELYKHLNVTSVEILRAHDGRYIVVDEEGRLKPNARTNVKATLLYLHGSVNQLVGKVLVCKPSMIH